MPVSLFVWCVHRLCWGHWWCFFVVPTRGATLRRHTITRFLLLRFHNCLQQLWNQRWCKWFPNCLNRSCSMHAQDWISNCQANQRNLSVVSTSLRRNSAYLPKQKTKKDRKSALYNLHSRYITSEEIEGEEESEQWKWKNWRKLPVIQFEMAWDSKERLVLLLKKHWHW